MVRPLECSLGRPQFSSLNDVSPNLSREKGARNKRGDPDIVGTPSLFFADFRAVVRLLLRLFCLLLPQEPPQELPGPWTARPRGAGHLVDELGLAWQLVDRALAPAELDQILLQCIRALLTRFELDKGLGLLAHHRVRNAHRSEERRVGKECR